MRRREDGKCIPLLERSAAVRRENSLQKPMNKIVINKLNERMRKQLWYMWEFDGIISGRKVDTSADVVQKTP